MRELFAYTIRGMQAPGIRHGPPSFPISINNAVGKSNVRDSEHKSSNGSVFKALVTSQKESLPSAFCLGHALCQRAPTVDEDVFHPLRWLYSAILYILFL